MQCVYLREVVAECLVLGCMVVRSDISKVDEWSRVVCAESRSSEINIERKQCAV